MSKRKYIADRLEGVKASGGAARFSWAVLRESLKLQPSHQLSVQFVRSLVVSVIALIFDFGFLVILKELAGVHYLVAAALSFTIGVTVNYFLSIWWVFAHRKLSSRQAEYAIFVTINVIGLVLNLVIIAALVQLLDFDYRLAKAVSTVVVFFWNFAGRKKLLY